MELFILGVFGPSQIIFFSLILMLIALVIYILFNVSMQRAMNAVSSENRKMEGGLIWLNLIPILNIVWPFIFNNALRSSYKNEFNKNHKRNRSTEILKFTNFNVGDAIGDVSEDEEEEISDSSLEK